MAQARLPEDMEGSTLATMTTGETCYTTPWAMWADTGRRLWLHPGYPAHTAGHGNAQMRVELRLDGYHVWDCGHKYEPVSGPGYASPADTAWLPVVTLHRRGEEG